MEKATEAESGEKPEGDEVPDLEGLQARGVSPMGTPHPQVALLRVGLQDS